MQFAYDVKVKDIENNDTVVVNISRHETNCKDLARFKKILRKFNETGANARGKMMLLFTGYENDHKEIYEIQAIRGWVAKAFNYCPYLFYFLTDAMQNNSCILACLGDCTKALHMPFGEPKTVPEYLSLGLSYEELPKATLMLSLTDEVSERVANGIMEYGALMNDMTENISGMISCLMGGQGYGS